MQAREAELIARPSVRTYAREGLRAHQLSQPLFMRLALRGRRGAEQ